MQAILLSIVQSKIFPWALVGLLVFGGGMLSKCQSDANARIQDYNRQLEGKLSDQEREMQQLNTALGLAKSELLTQKELSERYKKDREEIDEEFDKFVKKHNLEIASRDRTIAKLKQKIGGDGTAVVVAPNEESCKNVEKCVISYNWEDTLKRFKLTDPNIWESGDEVFESEQVFKIYGEVFQQKDGSLQTRRLVLREVTQLEDGTYEPIPNGKAEIVDSKFEYQNPPRLELEKDWTDLFTLRMIAVGSVTAFPDPGATNFGLGVEFFNWEGLGINTYTAINFKNIEKTEQRLGVTYSPTFFDRPLNLGIGASVGTPFANFFQEVSVNIDLIFYLWLFNG